MEIHRAAAAAGAVIPNGFKVSETFSLHQIDLQSTTSQLFSNLPPAPDTLARSLDGYCIGTSANSYGLVGALRRRREDSHEKMTICDGGHDSIREVTSLYACSSRSRSQPNFMKAAPVMRALRDRGAQQTLVHTGQHYDANMSDVFFTQFGDACAGCEPRSRSGSHAKQTADIMSRF